MIRPIDIKINAAHPELPLAEASAYTGAPSTVLIRGVPGSCGKWAITAVQVCATFPDNATVCREAVQSANGVWVATLPGSSTSGRTRSGLWITASGVDENGAAVTGYILGVADFAIYALGTAPAPAPGGTSYAMHYFESLPSAANEGDVALDGDAWKIYSGDEWVTFGGGTLDNAVTRTSANGVKSSGIWAAIWGALSALPTGFSSLYDWCVSQLSGKASTADATLTERGFSAWTMSPATMPGGDAYPQPELVDLGEGDWQWKIQTTAGLIDEIEEPGAKAAKEAKTSIAFQWAEVVTANRTALPGYQLGNDDQHILASEAEAEALRTGKQSKITASGILKGDGAGGVSAATAGTDYQAPLGFTPENASNKVTSLTAQSTDTQYPSAKCVYDAIQGVDVKPTRIYNSAGTDALDDKGQLFKSSTADSYYTFTTTGGTVYNCSYQGYTDLGNSGPSVYAYKIANDFYLAYNPSGKMLYAYFGYMGWVRTDIDDVSVAANLHPENGDILPTMNGITIQDKYSDTYTGDAVFTPTQATLETTPYAHFSLESIPDREYSNASTYAVGDLVKYRATSSDPYKAYRCIAATTSSDTTAPSADSTHWTEIPVLSQKADAADLAPAFSTSSTYAVGEHVTYNGKLYKCTTAVTTAGAWDASKWTEDNIAATLGNIESALDIINNGAQS